jgi:hypothetical protein
VRELAVGIALLWAMAASAGPWVRGPGSFYAQLGGSGFRALPDPTWVGYAYQSWQASSFFELGLGHQLQASVGVPFVHAAQWMPPGGDYRNFGLGDLKLQLDRQLGRRPLALGLEVAVPLYQPIREVQTHSVQVGGREQPSVFTPELGSGLVELTPKLLVGRSLHPFPGWATAQLGLTIPAARNVGSVQASAGTGAFVVRDVLGFSLSTGASLNLPPIGQRYLARPSEWVSVHGQALLKAGSLAPGWMLTLGVGGLVWTRFGSPGVSGSVALSYQR